MNKLEYKKCSFINDMINFCFLSRGEGGGGLPEVRTEDEYIVIFLTKAFISPPNVYMSSAWLVPGITGGYNARWCQRAL